MGLVPGKAVVSESPSRPPAKGQELSCCLPQGTLAGPGQLQPCLGLRAHCQGHIGAAARETSKPSAGACPSPTSPSGQQQCQITQGCLSPLTSPPGPLLALKSWVPVNHGGSRARSRAPPWGRRADASLASVSSPSVRFCAVGKPLVPGPTWPCPQ